jgi:hypothetical protein
VPRAHPLRAPEAIPAVFPQAQVQRCVVPLIRPALAFVSYKDRKAAALKKIYKAKMPDWQNAMMLLRTPGGRNIPSLLAAEGDAVFCLSGRWIMDTTNAIERLNAKLRRAARGPFPTDERAPKLLFLVLRTWPQRRGKCRRANGAWPNRQPVRRPFCLDLTKAAPAQKFQHSRRPVASRHTPADNPKPIRGYPDHEHSRHPHRCFCLASRHRLRCWQKDHNRFRHGEQPQH